MIYTQGEAQIEGDLTRRESSEAYSSSSGHSRRVRQATREKLGLGNGMKSGI